MNTEKKNIKQDIEESMISVSEKEKILEEPQIKIEPKKMLEAIVHNVVMRYEKCDNSKIMGVFPKGTIFELLDEEGSWFKVKFENHEGYVKDGNYFFK